jgi:dTMP kinase
MLRCFCILSHMTEKQYQLIMFDGPDGVGKTTQIDLAQQTLRAAGEEVYVTRIHGGTDFGEALRTVTNASDIEREPLAEHFVFMAMHTQLRAELQGQLKAGSVVLLDRSPLSDWAYQICASGLESEEAERNIKHSMSLFNPELVICYRASFEVLQEHIINRPEAEKSAYYKNKPVEYHRAVIEGYHEGAKRFGAVVIDANRSIEEVHQSTMNEINRVLEESTR